jgi:hypothetical protein
METIFIALMKAFIQQRTSVIGRNSLIRIGANVTYKGHFAEKSRDEGIVAYSFLNLM